MYKLALAKRYWLHISPVAASVPKPVGVGRPLPIPECQPYKPSKRYRLLQLIGKLQAKFSKKDE